MIKKALVTGATGFVGSHLVTGLLQDGWQIDVIIRPTSSLSLLADCRDRIRLHEHDGSIARLQDILHQTQPDVVFHLASLFLSQHRPEDVDKLIQSNVLFGTQLLEAMACASVHNLVNTSTNWVHYEGKPYSPVNLYAATKQAFCDILQYYVEARGIQAITLELFDTYGPNDPRPKLMNLLLKVANTGEKLVMSPGEQKIDLVHIDDVVNAYRLAAYRLLDGKVVGHKIYGVGTGKPITLRELVSIIEKSTGKKLNIEWGGRPYRDREVMEPWRAFQILPGWKVQKSELSAWF